MTKTVKPATVDSHLPPSEKITLFRHLFRGRTDVYPVRWQSAQGRSGYSPACENEWRPGLCNTRKVKCGDCPNRLLLPVTDRVLYDHLAGKKTVGVYPLLDDNSCYFLAADFDKGDWQADANAFYQSCLELEIPAALEISRSGNGESFILKMLRGLPKMMVGKWCQVVTVKQIAFKLFQPNGKRSRII